MGAPLRLWCAVALAWPEPTQKPWSPHPGIGHSVVSPVAVPYTPAELGQMSADQQWQVLRDHFLPPAIADDDWYAEFAAAVTVPGVETATARSVAGILAWRARAAGGPLPSHWPPTGAAGLVAAWYIGERHRYDFRFDGIYGLAHHWLQQWPEDGLIKAFLAFGACGLRRPDAHDAIQVALASPDADDRVRFVCLHGLWFGNHLPGQPQALLDLADDMIGRGEISDVLFFRRSLALRHLRRYEDALRSIDRAISMLGSGVDVLPVHQDYVREREFVLAAMHHDGAWPSPAPAPSVITLPPPKMLQPQPQEDPLVAYGQNAEDIVLLRAFQQVQDGRYVDVGAGHPTEGSLTANLIQRRGWRGLDVEPQPNLAKMLRERHPNCIVEQVAVGSAPATATMYLLPSNWGMSTLVKSVADQHEADGWAVMTAPVEVTTLDALLERHSFEPGFEVLKIDAEGFELPVLQGCDLRRWRPQCLVVEATVPASSVPAHQSWEPLVLESGYVLALFDGLNRFYARTDLPRLREALSVPANVLDRFVPAKYAELELTAGRPRPASRP